MNPSQRQLPKPCPKLLVFFTTVLFFSIYYIVTTIRTITISSSQDPHYPPQLQEPSISHYSPAYGTFRKPTIIIILLSTLSQELHQLLALPRPINALTARQYSIERHYRRERHCPDSAHEKLRCLVPKPSGYKTPFPWPDSRSYAWFKNVPFKKLAEFKKTQNWVRLEGDRFVFPGGGGGASFPGGVKNYVDVILDLLPLASGSIRTVLDVGCGISTYDIFFLTID